MPGGLNSDFLKLLEGAKINLGGQGPLPDQSGKPGQSAQDIYDAAAVRQRDATESLANVFRYRVRVRMKGVGQNTIDIHFPGSFLLMPSFSWGASMDSSPPLVGNFAQPYALVLRWITHDAGPDKALTLYDGATVGISATGQFDQFFWMHLQFEENFLGAGAGTPSGTTATTPNGGGG